MLPSPTKPMSDTYTSFARFLKSAVLHFFRGCELRSLATNQNSRSSTRTVARSHVLRPWGWPVAPSMARRDSLAKQCFASPLRGDRESPHVAEPDETDDRHRVLLTKIGERIARPRWNEMRRDDLARQRGRTPVMPLRRIVLVDQQRPHALGEFAAPRTVRRDDELEAKRIGECECARPGKLLDDDSD